MGRFLASLQGEMQRLVGSGQVAEKLLQGAAPDQLKRILADADLFPKLLKQLGDKGFLIAAEVRKLALLDAQFTLLLPESGATFLPGVRALGRLAGQEFKEEKLGPTTLLHLTLEGVHICAWEARGHTLISIGSDVPQAALARANSTSPRLTSQPLFQRLQTLGKEETSTRAYVDLAGLLKFARSSSKEAAGLLSALGAANLKSLIYFTRFRGDALQSIFEVETDGSGPTLPGLYGGKPIRLADLPAFPEDAGSWSAFSLDAVALYDLVYRVLELGIRLYQPDGLAELQKLPKQIDEALGIDLRNELLAELDGQVGSYQAPSEGALTLGITVFLKVKDGAKVRERLETAIKTLGKVAGVDVRVRKRMYRGHELREVSVREEGFLFVPTFTAYKGWLVIGLFPQPVQGFILRNDGELPAWKPEPRVKAILHALPAQVRSVSVSDPRPGMALILSYVPAGLGLLRSLVPTSTLEVDTFPNANEVTRHLFPSVSVTTQTAQGYHSESTSSLIGPLEWLSADSLLTFYLVGSFLSIAL
jgi:hypothetical protein